MSPRTLRGRLPAILTAMPMRSSLLACALIAALAAVAALPGAELGGTWEMTWDTEGGIRHTKWKISQEGERVTVDADGQVFEGTYKGNRMVIEGRFYASEAGYAATMKVEGTLDPDGTMKGRGTWDQYAMTFTAKRAK